jgi:hypothetical protein
LESGLDFIDLRDERPEFSQLALVPRPEDHFYQPNHDDLRQFTKIACETLRDETQSVKANRCNPRRWMTPNSDSGVVWWGY